MLGKGCKRAVEPLGLVRRDGRRICLCGEGEDLLEWLSLICADSCRLVSRDAPVVAHMLDEGKDARRRLSDGSIVSCCLGVEGIDDDLERGAAGDESGCCVHCICDGGAKRDEGAGKLVLCCAHE